MNDLFVNNTAVTGTQPKYKQNLTEEYINEFYDKVVNYPEFKEKYSEILQEQGYSVDDEEELMMANEELIQDIKAGTISKRDEFFYELIDFIEEVKLKREHLNIKMEQEETEYKSSTKNLYKTIQSQDILLEPENEEELKTIIKFNQKLFKKKLALFILPREKDE